MAYNKERVNFLLTQDRSKVNVEELIRLNTGLINKQLGKFKMTQDPDALSLAYEALHTAILTYDATKNSAFSTYATVCIYNRLGSLIRSRNTVNTIETVSYDIPIAEDLTMADTMQSNEYTEDGIMRQYNLRQVLQVVNYCSSKIKTPMHKEIITLWKTSAFTMTHSDIANKLNCSQSYVSQVINKFRLQIKKCLIALEQGEVK